MTASAPGAGFIAAEQTNAIERTSTRLGARSALNFVVLLVSDTADMAGQPGPKFR